MIVAYAVEPSRVHVTGFSQGAFATWNILCLASDVVCSAAPLSSSGLDPWSQVRRLRQIFWPKLRVVLDPPLPPSSPSHARAVWYALPGGHADRVLIGALGIRML